MKPLLTRLTTVLRHAKDKFLQACGERTIDPEIDPKSSQHQLSTSSSSGGGTATGSQTIQVDSPAISGKTKNPAQSITAPAEDERDRDHVDVDEEPNHRVPATVEAFLRIRSDLDLTGKVEQVSIIHQSMGGYSDIYTGYCNCSDGMRSKVAVKKLRAHIQNNRTFEKDLVREMYIWSKLKHPRILSFEGFYLEHDNYPFLVSKWMDGGTAVDYVKNNPQMDLVRLCLSIAEGLNYLHNEGIIHSDVKPENVLMSSSGDPFLCDFGLSRRLVASQTFQFSASLSNNTKGTTRYMTKELLYGNAKPSEKSDVWAFGMTILALLTMKSPYHDRNDAQVLAAIHENELPSLPAEFDSQWPARNQSLWYIATFCWRSESFRPSMTVIRSALEYLNPAFGTVQRRLSKQEAYSQALMAISKIYRPIKDVIRDDPSGNFLRVYVDGPVNMNDTVLAELGNTKAPCTTRSNIPVYFASAEVDGSIVPGKFSGEWDIPFRLAYGHKEHSVAVGTALKFDPELMELVGTSEGEIPEGKFPVVGGKEPDGTILYHAISEVQGLRIPGKAGKHLGGAKIGEGWEHLRPRYELLCWKV